MAEMGRPTKYKQEYATQAEKLCRLGATDVEVADFLGIHVSTLYRWSSQHEEFCESLKAGKEIADNRVESSLYRRATGYEREDVKIFMPAGAEDPVYAPYTAHHPPDVTACIFWLKNRKPEEYRDKKDFDVSGNVEHNHKVDLSKLSDEELEIVERIITKSQ